ncbi:hypothetical protein GUJ93_ZPchr0001g32354 [Zizania palustris]|uniref:Uncharacterized protein n=1 Tax=Zizania palustris TaxID=103762 RepID=A0A8J5VSD0_ZIZPA|nr:hypothetical protein GUJ93_ZPchr0001g32354 [Zizania palustris]
MPLCTPASYNVLLAGYFYNRLPSAGCRRRLGAFFVLRNDRAVEGLLHCHLSQRRPLRRYVGVGAMIFEVLMQIDKPDSPFGASTPMKYRKADRLSSAYLVLQLKNSKVV